MPLKCEPWPGQEELDLLKCHSNDFLTIGEANGRNLLPLVKVISLRDNKNISGQLDVLLSHSDWHALQELNPWGCDLTEDDMRTLGKANTGGLLPLMRTLKLGFNRALSGELGLLFMHKWPCLEVLDLDQMAGNCLHLGDIWSKSEKCRTLILMCSSFGPIFPFVHDYPVKSVYF